MIEKGSDYEKITTLLASGRIEEGANLIDQLKPTLREPVLLECLGNLHFYQKRQQEAINSFEAAMLADEHYDVARYHYLIAVKLEVAGEFAEAIWRYQAAIEIEPTFVDTYIELGGLCSKMGEFKAALQCYRDALRLDSHDLRIYSNLMTVLMELYSKEPSKYCDEYLSAVSDFEKAQAVLPAIDESGKFHW